MGSEMCIRDRTGLEKVSESCKYMLPVLRFSEEKSEGGRFLCEEWNAL